MEPETDGHVAYRGGCPVAAPGAVGLWGCTRASGLTGPRRDSDPGVAHRLPEAPGTALRTLLRPSRCTFTDRLTQPAGAPRSPPQRRVRAAECLASGPESALPQSQPLQAPEHSAELPLRPQTYTGSILLAVNPFQELPLYTPEQVQLYHRRQAAELPPHVFAVANSCYFNMQRNKRDQCCVIRWGPPPSGSSKPSPTRCVTQGSGQLQHPPHSP